MRIRTLHPRRAGFTLVELLVSMALIVLIMAILSEAFVEGLASVRHLKAIGDMQESLRATVPLRDDLLQRHFEGSQKLSVDFDKYTRPDRGFFRIQQAAAHSAFPQQYEGADPDGLPSYRITGDILHMTVANVGSRRTDYVTAIAPGVLSPANPGADPSNSMWKEGPPDYQQWAQVIPGSNPPQYDPNSPGWMNSQWSEVMWFLTPMIDPDSGFQMAAGASNTPLWNLHRRQRLLAVSNHATLNTTNRIASTNLGLFPEIACKPDLSNNAWLYFTSPASSARADGRAMADAAGNSIALAMGTALGESPSRRGDDRVIPDVVSFEIKVYMPIPGQAAMFREIREVQALLALPQTGIYDTATWPANAKLTIKAVQIILRVWDSRTEQTRQITLIQDM